MSRKLIFLDIDGTLTVAGSNVPPASALEVIRGAQRRGNLVFLCTGRNLAMLSPLLQYGFDGIVASAGGYLKYRDETIYDHPMTDEQLRTALDTLHGSGVFCTVEALDATYGDENLGDFLGRSEGGNSEIRRWRAALAGELGIRPMREYDGRPVYKVVFMCTEASQLDAAKAALEQDFNFCCQSVARPACLNGELINRAFDKGRGIRRICDYLGADLGDTYGFGDSMNDLEMIQTAGVSIVMENGAEELKSLADYICPAVEKDGLAKAFAHFDLF